MGSRSQRTGDNLHPNAKCWGLAQQQGSYEDGLGDEKQRIADLEARLLTAEDALERCERLAVASRFAGAIMHEVNNPLEALTNLVYLTSESSTEPEKVRHNMEIAAGQLARVAEITHKTLSFYRDQKEAKMFDLVEIAESALQIHSRRLRLQGVELKKRMHTPVVAQVMSGEILQVLSNLILNALDALPQEGAILHLRLCARSGQVHITIADNGHGIEEEVYAKLFEANHTTKIKGTGFGLWLSQKIIQRHEGKIRLRTSCRAGRSGTTFRLSLPVASRELMLSAAQASFRPSKARQFGGLGSG
jgi:C4-dicarboxylate-specific signal transduction histidine kinase